MRNGAGKTTAVQILSTLLPADGGDIRVAGHDLAAEPDAVRAAIGVTGQFSAVDNLLTGEENLRLMTDLHHLGRTAGRQRAAALLSQFGLADAAGKMAATYSGGMRRRLDLAMTLTGDPKLIFLDEPTTGLDPRSRRTMWEIIRTLVADGVTIFLTTQYLDEADQLADQIAVLDHGRIVVAGTPDELKRQIPGGHVELEFASFADLAAAVGLVNATSRFRTMSIARASVLTGHVLGSMIQALLGVGVLIGLAFAIGFRSAASPLAWLAAIGLLTLTALALTWLTVAMGLAAKSVETASNTPMFLLLLPFLGSGFVPTSSLPAGLRWFAEYQPFTPVTTAVRRLLEGGAIGDNAVIAIAWGAVVALGAYLWARHVYNTRPLPVR